MSAIAGFSTPSRTSGARAAAIVARAAAAIGQMWKSFRNRRDFYRLGEMSDTELADIGLTRTDFYVAVTGPFGSDPTTRLGAIAEHRFRTIEDGARLSH